MNREELDRELDKWLDRAAAEYRKAEIRPGFENRIIAKLNSRPERKRWHFHWIPAAAAVLVILGLSAYLLRNQFQNQGTTEVAIERHPGSAAVPAANADFAGKYAKRLGSSQSAAPIFESSTKRSVRRPAFVKAREAKGERFLSSGISDQERYLIAFVREISKEKSQDMPEQNLFEPLQIPKAQIPAFQIENFEISSFEIEALPKTIPGSEEEL
jgi:hypothetical protein